MKVFQYLLEEHFFFSFPWFRSLLFLLNMEKLYSSIRFLWWVSLIFLFSLFLIFCCYSANGNCPPPLVIHIYKWACKVEKITFSIPFSLDKKWINNCYYHCGWDFDSFFLNLQTKPRAPSIYILYKLYPHFSRARIFIPTENQSKFLISLRSIHTRSKQHFPSSTCCFCHCFCFRYYILLLSCR